jgi:hypothetical protein
LDSRVRLVARRGSVSQAFTLTLSVAREKASRLRAAGWEVRIVDALAEDADVLRLGEPMRSMEDQPATGSEHRSLLEDPTGTIG